MLGATCRRVASARKCGRQPRPYPRPNAKRARSGAPAHAQDAAGNSGAEEWSGGEETASSTGDSDEEDGGNANPHSSNPALYELSQAVLVARRVRLLNPCAVQG